MDPPVSLRSTSGGYEEATGHAIRRDDAGRMRLTERYPWLAVVFLTVIYTFAMMDRQIVTLVVGDIKKQFQLDDFRVGLLMGPAFGIFYILGGPLFGMLVDRFPRKWVLAFGLAVWSVSASAGGLAKGYGQLFLARMFVGAGEGSVAPTAYSLISDIFPRHRIASALSIFAIGGTVGGGLSLLIGGMILGSMGGHPVAVPLLGVLAPWQVLFVVTGLPGFALLLLVAALHDPRTAGRKDLTVKAKPPPLRPFLRARRKVLAFHFATFCTAGLVTYSFAGWLPEFMTRAFGWQHGRAGVTLGLIMITTSVISHSSTGFIVDHLVARGVKDAYFRVYRLMLVIALPVVATMFFYKSPLAVLAGAFTVQLLVIPFTAFASSSLQMVTPPQLRGVMSGIFLAVLGVIGLSVGPSLVGFVSDHVVRDEARLGLSITLVTTTGVALAILFLTLGLKPLRDALADAAPPDAAPA